MIFLKSFLNFMNYEILLISSFIHLTFIQHYINPLKHNIWDLWKEIKMFKFLFKLIWLVFKAILSIFILFSKYLIILFNYWSQDKGQGLLTKFRKHHHFKISTFVSIICYLLIFLLTLHKGPDWCDLER